MTNYRLSFDTKKLKGFQRQINKAMKDVDALARDERKEIVKDANDFTSIFSQSLGQRIQRRYKSKNIPSYDAFTGESFPRQRNYFDRTGALKNVKINARTKRTSRVTFNKGIQLALSITAGKVSVNSSRPWIKGYQAEEHLTKVTHNSGIKGAGDPTDVFSMVEYGIGHMRFEDRPYRTFSGEVFDKTQGFFALDRIVKDEYVKAQKSYAEGLLKVIRD